MSFPRDPSLLEGILVPAVSWVLGFFAGSRALWAPLGFRTRLGVGRDWSFFLRQVGPLGLWALPWPL